MARQRNADVPIKRLSPSETRVRYTGRQQALRPDTPWGILKGFSPKEVQRVKKMIVWVVVAVAVIAAAVLLFRPSSSGGFQKVDSAGLAAAQKAGAQIVDVRTPGEFQMGHIKGSINVPVSELRTTAASWNRDKEYVLYCASGQRSADAQNVMKDMGFKNVADLVGGVASWNGGLEQGATSAAPAIPVSGKPVMIEFYTPT